MVNIVRQPEKLHGLDLLSGFVTWTDDGDGMIKVSPCIERESCFLIFTFDGETWDAKWEPVAHHDALHAMSKALYASYNGRCFKGTFGENLWCRRKDAENERDSLAGAKNGLVLTEIPFYVAKETDFYCENEFYIPVGDGIFSRMRVNPYSGNTGNETFVVMTKTLYRALAGTGGLREGFPGFECIV